MEVDCWQEQFPASCTKKEKYYLIARLNGTEYSLNRCGWAMIHIFCHHSVVANFPNIRVGDQLKVKITPNRQQNDTTPFWEALRVSPEARQVAVAS